MAQNTNLNVSPYYDDFDKYNNFYRVLYRPGFPIQARELTTLQSILQNQIENVGSHLFKDGSMVIPGSAGFDNNVDCILIQSSFLGSEVELYREQLTGCIITGITTNVKAKILYSIPASESDKEFITIYIKYIEAGGINKTITKFSDNEQISSNIDLTYGTTLLEIGSPFAQLIPSDATSIGSVAYVNTGVYYIRGHFVDVPYQYLILEQYSKNPTYRVGLEISESIVTSEDDSTLNDNAAGSSNYAAPGAHRFRIKTALIKKTIDDDADKNFLELIRIVSGKIQTKVDKSTYNVIEDSLASRTYDQSGDFMTVPFDIKVRECLNDGFNNGVYNTGEYTQDRNVLANESLYAVEIGSGKAYLKGYKVGVERPTYLDLDKPRDYSCNSNNILPFEIGNYADITNIYGTPVISGPDVTSAYQIIELRDQFSSSAGTAAGNQIGTARVFSYEWDGTGTDGTSGNSNDYYRIYVFDIAMFTKIKLASSTTITAGSLIRGKTSGAKGYIRVTSGNSITSDILTLTNVEGSFRAGEVITIDGIDYPTISAVWTHQYSDTRQFVGRNSSNTIIFTADLRIKEIYKLAATKFTYNSGSGIITGFNSNISPELRPGDLLYVSATQWFKVTDISTSTYSTSSIFNYTNQTATVTVAGGSITNGAEFTSVYRYRPQLQNKQNGDLFTEMPKNAIKTISDESMIVRRNFDAQITSNSFTISLPENQQFEALETENYNLVVTAVSGGSSYTVGQVLILQNSTSGNPVYTTFNTTGVARSTITVSNLVGITSIRLNAAVSKNVLTSKVKNANEMSVWKVSRTSNQKDQQLFGLSYSNIYGTRIEDEDIALGISDSYKLLAVYESDDSNDAVIPYVTLVEPAFFATGSLVTGKISGAKALVVDFNSSTLKLTLVYQTSNKFSANEILLGTNSLGASIQGLVSDTEGAINAGSKNITSYFTLESGQAEFYYGLSKLVRKKGSRTPIRKLKIVADWFSHESTGDYFNINSYVGIDYSAIPSFMAAAGSGSLVRTKQLRDVLDFRPAAKKLISGTGSVSDPYYMQCSSLDFASRVFDTTGTIFDIPKPDSDFRCDYCYYLKRIDKLFVDTTGRFFIKQGKSAEYPTPPETSDDCMLLSVIGHNAYGFDPTVDTYVFKENIKRYTMRDVALLEKRIQNIEYYSAMTLLEQETNALTIKDDFGNDKFKNGFVVDPFENQSVADLENDDYSASIDITNRILRPSHYTTNCTLELNETLSSNIAINNNIATLPFVDSLLIQQPYASQVENVNPFNVFTFIGNIELTPSSDDWVDTNILPVNTVQVEGNFQSQSRLINADQNGFGPQQWGSWQENWSGATTTVSGGEWRGWLGPLGRVIPEFGTRTTTTTGIIERRTGTQQRLVTRFDTQSLGSRVVSQSSVSWIRSRNISIGSERLKPSTRFYAFFDNVNVTSYVTPKLVEVIKNTTTDSRTNTTPFQVGEMIIGQTSNTRIKVAALNDGYKYNPYTDVELSDTYSSETNVINIDTISLAAMADGQYYGNFEIGEVVVGQTSGAKAVIKDRRLITDRRGTFKGTFFIPRPTVSTNPRFSTGRKVFKLTTSSVNAVPVPGTTIDSNAQVTYEASGTLQNLQETILSVRNADIVTDSLSEQRTTSRTRQELVQIGYWDPLAQSFIVEEKGGCYLSKVEVFFFTKDSNIPISCQIREVQNGVPTNKILPFSTTTVYPENVETSENASVATTFRFKAPVYLSDTQEYCFVLFSDSNEYNVWISEMGKLDISGDRTISSQPYAGVLFKSQNASTWTPNQLQDLKFNIYRAKFTSLSGQIVLNNAELGLGNNGIVELREDPIVTYKPDQTYTLNDNVAAFTVGARIFQKTTNASATIKSVNTTATPRQITVTDIDGTFLTGGNIGGVVSYPLVSSQSTSTIYLSIAGGVLTGDYTIGKTVTGQTSGSTAIVTGWNNSTGQLTLNYVSNTFTVGETIRQASPTIDSVLLASPTPAYTGDTYQKYITSSPSYASSSKKITVRHSNHGMHDLSNYVTISGIRSEVSPTTLKTAITLTDTSISVSDASAFHKKINGLAIDDTNPGYIRIDKEIIAYTAISNDGFTITVKTSGGRGANQTVAASHAEGAIVECYNLDGIPLIEINKTHEGILNPTLDSYELLTTSVANIGIVSGTNLSTLYSSTEVASATQNIPFEVITPNITSVILPKTSIISKINTLTGSSIANYASESSFVNDGNFIDIILNDSNELDGQKLILSKVNEDAKISGQKSLTIQCNLISEVDNLTPVIDLDRISVITTTNRINNPSEWDSSTLSVNDPHDAVYITRMIPLDNQVARALKVYFDANRMGSCSFRVLYRVVPSGFADDETTLPWIFFNTNGSSDSTILPVNDDTFKSYEYSASGLAFTKFQIKIAMSSTNQAIVPKFKYFRAVATAS